MSTTRIWSISGGNRSWVRTMSGMASASSRASQRISIRRSAAISALTAASKVCLKSGGMSGRLKSIRASPGSMLPPVTSAPKSRNTVPHSTCSPEWVRMSVLRRSSSSAPVTVVPGGGTGSPGADSRNRSSPLRVPTILVCTPAQISTPWSGG
jgi:hypothetical protein